MSTVIHAMNRFKPVAGSVDAIAQADAAGVVYVGDIMNLLEKLFIAGIISANTFRLGAIVCARFQEDGALQTTITRGTAATTCILVDDEPYSGFTDSDPTAFSISLKEIQYYVGLFNHTSEKALKAARSRSHHFTEGKHPDFTVRTLKHDEEVCVQWRESELDDIEQHANALIERKLMIAKFATIRTK